MTATIYSNKLLIGTAQLQIGDESMGGVFGEFFPNDNYYEKIQKSVWDFWATHKPDYKKWHSLRINAQLENGNFLFPTGGYTIDDFKQDPDEPKRIDITGADVDALKFENDFLINPWEKINIDQKIGLEDELQKELKSTKKSFFGLTSKIRQHILLDTEFSAIATHRSSDDVLFAINRKGNDNRYAVVHLTWKGEKEVFDNCPFTSLYFDFEDFINRRMKPDHDDWDD